MTYILVGTILTLLTYDRDVGGGHLLGVIPHFIGFIILLYGLHRLENVDEGFGRTELGAYVMTVYSLIFYILKALGIFTAHSGAMAYLAYFMELFEGAGTLLISYRILWIISNVAHKRRWDLGCTKAQKLWKIMAGSYILYFVSYITMIVMTNKITIDICSIFKILQLAAVLLYLFSFYFVWAHYMEETQSR